MRIVRRAAALFCALFFSVAHSVTPQDTATGETPTQQALTVVHANVWSGLTYEGVLSAGEYEPDAAREFRSSLLTEQLAAISPDIVGVNGANPLPDYAEQLAASLEMAQVSHWRMAGVRIGPVGLPANLREGDAILANPELGLEYAGRLGLSGGPAGNVTAFQLSEANQLLGARVTAAGRTVYVFVTRLHASPFASESALNGDVARYTAGELPPDSFLRRMERAVTGKTRRSAELERALVYINEMAGKAPAILLGSLNIVPDGEEAARLRQAGFADAFALAGSGAGNTWDPQRNLTLGQYGIGPWDSSALRLDYIWIRGDGLQVRRAELVLDESTYGVHPSVRFGVLAEIVVNP